MAAKFKRFPREIKFLTLLMLFSYHQVTFSQQQESFTIKRYTSKNGLPQNSIRSMVMDESRFLWMSTEEGLVRFDGRNFKTYNQTNYPEIHNDRFRVIMKTIDGKILVNELTGATFVIDNGEIELIKKGDPGKSFELNIRGTAPDLAYYIRAQEKEFAGIAPDELPRLPLFLLPLPGKQYGVFINKTSSFRVFNDSNPVKDITIPQENPHEFFSYNDLVYFFDRKNNIFNIDISTGKINKITLSGDLILDKLSSFPLSKNVIWNTAYRDVHIKIENKLYSLTSAANPLLLKSELVTSQLPSNCIVSDAFYDDKSSSLFIGTDTKGLYIFRKNSLKTLTYNNAPKNLSNSFYSQCDIDSHTVFTSFRREFNIQQGRLSTLPVYNNNQECLVKDRQNRMYYSTWDTIHYIDLNTKSKGFIKGPPTASFYCFELDGDSILVGSSLGVGYIKNFKYHHIYHHSDKSLNAKIEYLKRGPDGKIWIARCKGVGVLDTKTGLLQEVEGLSDICARVLFRDQLKMFIGTYGNGYYVWEAGKTTRLPADKNQCLSHVHSFLIDNNNYLWMSTNKGLFRTRYQNILNFLDNQDYKVHYEFFGDEDGILNTEFNGGCSPTVLRLKNGYVSYPTIEGLVWFIPEKIREDKPDESILIDELLVNNKPVSLKGIPDIPAKHEFIEINFATPYWGNASNLNIEYKLEGFNRNWIPVNPNDNKLTFSNLSSGSYRLKMRKLPESGEAPYIEASIGFTVHKKFYETSVFIIFAILAGTGLFYLLLVLNSRRIIKRNTELEQRIAERTVELKNVNSQLAANFQQLEQKERFLMDSIEVKNQLISIISHDIITPLKFISMVSRISKKNPGLLDRNKLIDSMNDIEFASDKLYNNANNILNWMKFQNNRIVPKMDHIALHDFIDEIVEPLQGMAETKGLIIDNHVPDEDIIVSDRNILMIILQNLLSNAIKYSEKGTISFNAFRKDNYYNITVADNGIGMSAELKKTIDEIISRKGMLTGARPEQEIGNQLGYYIIVDFLQLLGGIIRVESNVGLGTSVTVSLPEKA